MAEHVSLIGMALEMAHVFGSRVPSTDDIRNLFPDLSRRSAQHWCTCYHQSLQARSLAQHRCSPPEIALALRGESHV